MELPNPGIEPGSPALQADSVPTELSGKPWSSSSSVQLCSSLLTGLSASTLALSSPIQHSRRASLLAWESVHITLPLNFPTSPRERPKSSKWPKVLHHLTSGFLSDFIFFYFSVLSFATLQMHWPPRYPWDRPGSPHHHQHPPPAAPPKPLHGLPSWNAAPTIICMSCCLPIFS